MILCLTLKKFFDYIKLAHKWKSQDFLTLEFIISTDMISASISYIHLSFPSSIVFLVSVTRLSVPWDGSIFSLYVKSQVHQGSTNKIIIIIMLRTHLMNKAQNRKDRKECSSCAENPFPSLEGPFHKWRVLFVLRGSARAECTSVHRSTSVVVMLCISVFAVSFFQCLKYLYTIFLFPIRGCGR